MHTVYQIACCSSITISGVLLSVCACVCEWCHVLSAVTIMFSAIMSLHPDNEEEAREARPSEDHTHQFKTSL